MRQYRVGHLLLVGAGMQDHCLQTCSGDQSQLLAAHLSNKIALFIHRKRLKQPFCQDPFDELTAIVSGIAKVFPHEPKNVCPTRNSRTRQPTLRSAGDGVP